MKTDGQGRWLHCSPLYPNPANRNLDPEPFTRYLTLRLSGKGGDLAIVFPHNVIKSESGAHRYGDFTAHCFC